MAIVQPSLHKRWLSPTHVLFIAGILAGPLCLNLTSIRVQDHSWALQVLSEAAVLISLYAAGIKLRIPFNSYRWRTAVTLASVTMLATVGLCAALGWYLFGMSVGAALLFGAILSPTDPVLADKVQVKNPEDTDELRQSLTGEAGLNDGTAFPFVMLAIGLCAPDLHPPGMWRWLALDLIWPVVGGFAIGMVGGTLLGRWSWYRSPHQHHEGVDELLAIGFIAIIYGLALTVKTYGFLSVFAAAVCLRRGETLSPDGPDALRESSKSKDGSDNKNQSILLREQTAVASALEKIAQAFLMVVVGIILTSKPHNDWRIWVFAALLIFIIRPLAVFVTSPVASINSNQRKMIAWFGIRGIGTIYYLAFAITLGVGSHLGPQVTPIIDTCIATITLSVWLHGISDTPLMRWYSRNS